MAVAFAPEVADLEKITVQRRRLLDRLTNRDLVIGVVVSLVGATLVAVHGGRFPFFAGDEGIYVDQAWAVTHGRVVPYVYTYDHPFLGWVQLAPLITVAGWLHLGGSLTVAAGRAVMVLYAFATLLLTYGVARRLQLRPCFAALAVLLLGLCPLFLIDARQVYLDNIAVPWVLAAFYLALSPRRRQWTYASSAVLFAVGVLSKETVLLFLPALVWVVWTRAYRPTRAMSMTSFCVMGTLVVGIYPLFAALRNELLPGSNHVSLWSNGIMYQLATRKGSGAVWQTGSARRQLLDDWLSWDHLLLAGGVLGCVIVFLAVTQLRPIALAFVLWAVPVLKPGGYLPAMYVIAALPFAALLTAGCVDAAHHWVSKWLRNDDTRVVAIFISVVCSALVVLAYLPGIDRIMSNRTNASAVTAAAESYIEKHAARTDNLVVDDDYWTDLVRAGYPEPWHGVISYYKFDLDPVTSKKDLPQGWQDIDYVITTPEMRANVSALGLPNLAATIAHSTVVARFGTGHNVVQVRRVRPTPYNHTSGGNR